VVGGAGFHIGLAPNLMRLITCIILSLCFASALQAADSKATQAQINQLKKEISTLQKTVVQREVEANQLDRALRSSELEISRLSGEIRALDKQLAELGHHAGTLEEKRDRIRLELDKRAVLIEQQLRAQYKQGRQNWLQVLLTQRSPEELSRMMRYFSSVNRELAGQLQTFRQQLDELNTTETELTDTEQKIVDRRSRLKLEHSALEQSRAQRERALAAIKQGLKNDQQRLSQLETDRKRLEKVLEQVQRSIDKAALARDGRAFSELKGKLGWPLQGKIKRSFGSVQDNIRYDGIWIAGGNGAPVAAAHHGRVVFSDWLRGYGLVMIIDHGGNYLTLYGYNETLQREVGDWVSAGETIATVGTSGGRSASGLYFAIRYKGKATDPKGWLAR
jgi:septal ring factor EnvC (AmiA/AmiB activator)